jgi:hypothetical protein
VGLGSFLGSAINETTHIGGDVAKFGERYGGDALGGVEKVPVLGNVVHDVAHGLMNMANWDRDTYTDVISRPVSTFALAGVNMNSWGDALKGSTWSKSWDESAHVSPGQAFMGNVDATFDFDGDNRNAEQENKYLQNVFASPDATSEYFKHGSTLDKIGSGSYDAVLGWYSDPSVLVGHGASAYRLAAHSTDAIRTTADTAKAMSRPEVQKVLDATEKMAPYQAKKLPFIAKSANPDLLASIFNSGVSREIKEHAFRYMISDGNDEVSRQFLQDAASSAVKQQAGLRSLVKGWGSTADQTAGIMESLANAQQKFNPLITMAHLDGEGNRSALQQALHGLADDTEKKLAMPGTKERMLDDILNMKGHITWMPGTYDVPISAMRAAFQGADKFGDASQLAQHLPAGTTLPGKWVTQVIYKGLYQTPLKVFRAFGDAWPDGWLDYTNPKAGDTLEAFLNRARGLDPAIKQGFLNQFYEAGSDVGKKQAIVQQAEHTAARATLMAKGFGHDDAEAILAGTYSRRAEQLLFGTQRAARRPGTQAFSAATYGPEGLPADVIQPDIKSDAEKYQDLVIHGFTDEDGVPYHVPILETMKRQGTPLLDLDKFDSWAGRNHGKYMLAKQGIGTATDTVAKSLDVFQDLWKGGVLLRLGFTPRVLTDMGLRAIVTLGGMNMLKLSAESLKTELKNMGVAGYDTTNRLLKNRLFAPGTIKDANDTAGILTTLHDGARADYYHAASQKLVDDEAVKAGLPNLIGTPTDEQVEAAKQRFLNSKARLDAAQAAAKGFQKARFGDGALKIQGVPLTDLYGGENAEWLSQQNDSDRILNKMLMRNSGMEKGLSGSGAWDTIRADSQNELEAASHPKAWRHAINNQIMGDTLASKVVNNNWNSEDIVKWLKTREGKAYMVNIPGEFRQNYQDYADRVAAHVHQTVPAEVREEIANKGKRGVSLRDLDRLVPSVGDRPEINGQLLNYNLGKAAGIVDGTKTIQHNMHKILGSMPINVLVQHPAAVGFYRARLQQSIDKYISFRDADDLAASNKTIPQQIKSGHAGPIAIDADTIKRIETEAAAQAKNDLWSIMYDMSTRSTAAHQLRFLFPFFGAQQEILNHWFGIALDHPYIYGREQQIWNSPGKAGLVYNTQTGDPADQNTPLADQAVRFQIPHELSRLPGLGALNDIGQMNIAAGSLNPILQGQHFYIPGAGPIAQVSVQQLAKYNPALLDNKALNLILPYGPGDNISQAVLPTWVQRLESGFNITAPQYATTFAKVYQTETIRYNEGERSSVPTMGEIQARTKQLLLIQALASAVLPFSATFNPGTQTGKQKPRADVTSGLETASAPDLTKVPIQGLIDQYKKLESVDPANAATNFYNKYGQALFAVTTSTTKSNASVPATAAGLAAISNPDIRAMIQADPSVAYAIVGPQAASGSFDMAAYNAEMNTQIGGGNAETFRQTLDPADIVKEQQTQLGWQQYDQLMSIIQGKMTERGVTSLNQSGALDLKTLKDQFIANLNDPNSSEYNPGWYSQYSGTSTDWTARINSLTALVSDPNLVNNPGRTDLRVLGQYLEYRQAVNQILASRPNKEGLPSTLADKSNADIASEWDGVVSNLVLSNTNFALIYQHLLSGDPVNANLKYNQAFQNSLVVGQ